MYFLLLFLCLCIFNCTLICPPSEGVLLEIEKKHSKELENSELQKISNQQQKNLSETFLADKQPTPEQTVSPSVVPISSTLNESVTTLSKDESLTESTKKLENGKNLLVTREQSLSDWNKQWANLTQNFLGFSGGPLYKLPVDQRAQAVLDFISQVPTGFFSDPAAALKSLGKVIETAKSALAQDPNKTIALQKINDQVVKFAVQAIANGAFGKTPTEILENLDVGLFKSGLPTVFNDVPGARDALLQATLARLIPVIEALPVANWTELQEQIKQLDIPGRSETNVSTPLDMQAELIIANKAAALLATEKLPGNVTVQTETLAKRYFDAMQDIHFDDQNAAIVQKAFLDRVNKLADTTGNYLDVANGLLSEQERLRSTGINQQVAFMATVGSLLNTEANRPRFLNTNLTPESIAQGYIKEVQAIVDYLEMAQDGTFAKYFTNQDLPLKAIFIQNAERATLLLEFLNQQKNFLPQEEQNALTEALKKIPQARAADPFNLSQIDKNFWTLYQDIKRQKLFGAEGLYALPKDLASLGNQKLESLRKSTDPTVRTNVLTELYALRNLLDKPAFKEQLLSVSEFIKEVDAVDLQVFTTIDKLETSLQNAFNEVVSTAESGKLVLDSNKLSAMQAKLEDISQELSKVDTTSHTTMRLLNAQKYRDAVQTIITIGQDYAKVLNPQEDSAVIDTVYKNTINGLSAVVRALDYTTYENFSDRLKYMARQQEALAVLDAILQQPLLTVDGTAYSLSQLNSFMQNWFDTQKLPEPAVLSALEQAGLVTRKTNETGKVIGLLITDRGTSLRMVAQEEAAVARRVSQLRDYGDAYKSSAQAPTWQTEFATPTAQRVAQLADKLKLTQLILDDQVAALRNYYKQNLVDADIQELYKVVGTYNTILEVQNATDPLPGSFLNKSNLQDLADILDTLKQLNNGVSVDKPLEIFVQYKLLHPGQTPNIEQILQMEALRDEKLALNLNTRSLSTQFSDILTQAAGEISDAYTNLSLDLQKQAKISQQKISFWGKISSVVGGIFGFFVGKKALAAGSGGLSTLITSELDPLNNALGLVTGALATGVIYNLAAGLEVSDEEINSFNKLLLEHGKDPIVKQPGWLAQAREKASSFIKNDLQKALNIVKSQKDEAQRQTEAFQSAQASLYTLLELPATASFSDLVQAIKQLDADTNIVGRTANALKKHRVQNQLTTVVTIAVNLSKAYQKEILALSKIALKGIDNAAESNKGALASMGSAILAAAKGVKSSFSWFSDFFSSTKQEESSQAAEKAAQIKAIDFSQAESALRSFFGRQEADLTALITLIDANQAQLANATSLEPYKALQLVKDVLTGRVQSLRQEYLNWIEEQLKIKKQGLQNA